jgi:hypothetical protein
MEVAARVGVTGIAVSVASGFAVWPKLQADRRTQVNPIIWERALIFTSLLSDNLRHITGFRGIYFRGFVPISVLISLGLGFVA